MPVLLRHNHTLDLNLIEYNGVVTPAQLKGLAAYGARNPAMLRADTLSIVHPDGDFSAIDLRDLDLLFSRYRVLYAKLDFPIYRRAAWLCLSPSVDAHIDYWVSGRDLREGMSSAVRKFDTLAEAGDWLLLSSTEIAAVERGEGFEIMVRLDEEPTRAASR